jgi:uncharacterized membrane protein
MPHTQKSDPNDWWYSKPTSKQEHSHLIMFWKIKGFPVKKWYPKTQELNNWMIKYKVNTMLMAEINTFWARIPANHQWSKRMNWSVATEQKKELA